MIFKTGKKLESIESLLKTKKTPTPSPSASSSSSDALSLTRVIQIETLSKDVEKLKTKQAEMSLSGSKSLDINSDNVARWVEAKFDAFIRSPATRNLIRDILTAKLDAFQVSFGAINVVVSYNVFV